jgi:hypothetical protein
MILKKKKSIKNSNDLNHVAYCNPGVLEDAIRFEIAAAKPNERLPEGNAPIKKVMRFVCLAIYRLYTIVFFSLYLLSYHLLGSLHFLIRKFSKRLSVRPSRQQRFGNMDSIVPNL